MQQTLDDVDYSQIDYGIRNFIRHLNSRGYKTLFSCAGHKDVDFLGILAPDAEGYVCIKGTHDHDILRKIASSYVACTYIKNIRMREIETPSKTYRVTRIAFKPKNLGKWQGG